MPSAADVAAFLVEKAGPMDAMKLQKLVYYGQAWSLVLRGRPLFDDEIQAWAFGPVVANLYRLHRRQYVVSQLSEGDARQVAPDEARLLEAVRGYYGGFSSSELSDITHSEDPWQKARDGLSEGERSSRVISHEAMREYYAGQPPPFPW